MTRRKFQLHRATKAVFSTALCRRISVALRSKSSPARASPRRPGTLCVHGMFSLVLHFVLVCLLVNKSLKVALCKLPALSGSTCLAVCACGHCMNARLTRGPVKRSSCHERRCCYVIVSSVFVTKYSQSVLHIFISPACAETKGDCCPKFCASLSLSPMSDIQTF